MFDLLTIYSTEDLKSRMTRVKYISVYLSKNKNEILFNETRLSETVKCVSDNNLFDK